MHIDQKGLVRKATSAVQLAINNGWLTNTNVAAANTVQGLRDAVTNATARADDALAKSSIDKAIVALEDVGIYTDALIAPLTTTAGLIALSGEDAAGWASKYDE